MMNPGVSMMVRFGQYAYLPVGSDFSIEHHVHDRP